MREIIKLVKFGLKAASQASRVILDIYYNNDFTISEKIDKTPVTQADVFSDEVIHDVLSETKIPITSEESESMEDESTCKDVYWLVDPLDGTKEFIKRNGEFCVNIALVINGLPMIGVIAIPVQNTLFWSVAGKGVKKMSVQNWQSMDSNNVQPLPKPKLPIDGEKVVFLRSKSHHSATKTKFHDKLSERFAIENISVGSAIKFTYLAEGKGHIYHRSGPTMEWDTAAGHALLREVGGNIIDLSTEQELIYGKKAARNPEFLATVLPKSLIL
ncbi:3'(2'),5'-bisphosphate nucleotidase CysQ family protein [Thermaurantimonas aggregans]|uniref:3'(2'),5'-bisphosphate nucleotidase CysQ family protein n=1 Tax=Thermaurantimonas aggregans TaxID=2173829 RepID=UPI0023F23D34|nr:3'(2'),5'-bisphosphate nucleotidase CysQ [Thermaurantimonas aggregans]MCX8147686.1 3'(2'),5'-bisphosphate nucleotidase CysQ [Thermaurantimonas aggregans]